MRLSIAVFAAPYTQGADTAFHYVSAALAAGHQVHRVFFYHDGVYNGNRMMEPPQDETGVGARWSKLAADNELDLVICVASALRRGIMDATEADRYERGEGNLADGFTISGLGQLIDSAIESDRLISFGP